MVFSIFSIERIKYEKEMQIMNSTSVKKFLSCDWYHDRRVIEMMDIKYS